MRAGRSAMEHYAYKQAIIYFTNLFTPDCPQDLQVQANIAFADATINEDSTNKTADLISAINSLQLVVQNSSNSWQAAQAWGRIGDCYFQLGTKDPSNLTNAVNAYRNVIDSPASRSTAIYEARFNLAKTMERQAAQKIGDDQTDLLKQALHQYVTVLTENITAFEEGRLDPESSSALWARKSGTEAGRLAESLQQWKDALNIYTQLKQLLPGMAPIFEKKIAKVNEHH